MHQFFILDNCKEKEKWQDLKDAGPNDNSGAKYCFNPPKHNCYTEAKVDAEIAKYTTKCDTDTTKCEGETDENGLIINNGGGFRSVDPSNYHRFLCEADSM